MKITTTLCSLLLLCLNSFGQSPPETNSTRWDSISSRKSITQKNVINIKRLGADPTGQVAADRYVQMALSNSKQTGAIIYFPKGTYLLNKTINLTSNQYLAGDGSNQTTLRFDLGGKGHLITSIGQTFAGWSKIISETKKNEKVIKTDNEFISVGDIVRIKIDDTNKITSSWASGTIGQLCEVAAITKDQITFTDELRLDLTQAEHPQLIKVLPQTNVGVVNLKIVRMDMTSSQTDNIRFQYTKNAIVSGVHSDSCNFAHVNNLYSYANRIEGSFFTNAFNYGNGGKAYGVVLAFTSSQCMVENNVFQKLRHSILFQAASNGNIIGYNYSHEAYWTGVFSPSDFAGDIVMHGNYPFLNLIEGNIVQNVVIDNSHGINGPGNTFLRNRIENAGIFMNCSPSTDYQSFIGNEITGTGTSSNGLVPFPKGLYSLCGKGHYEFGNDQNGTIRPNKVDNMITSLYLDARPNFISSAQFPAIGYPNETKTGFNAAYDRRNLKIKTIEYLFEFPLGVRFNSIEAKKDKANDRIVVAWSTNTLNECVEFIVYRYDEDMTEHIAARVDCSKATTTHFTLSDYNFNPSNKHVSYKIECIDIFDDAVTSDHIVVALKEPSSGIKTNGQGDLFFDNEVQRIRVYDLKGGLVYKQNITSRNHTLPTSLISGIYVVEVYGNNTVARKKIGLNW